MVAEKLQRKHTAHFVDPLPVHTRLITVPLQRTTDHRNAQILAPFGATLLVMAHWVHVLGYIRGMASQHEVTASTLPLSSCQLPQPTYDTSNEMFPISVTLSYIFQRNPPRVLPKHAARPAMEMLVILACGNGLIVVRWPASRAGAADPAFAVAVVGCRILRGKRRSACDERREISWGLT